MKIHMINDAKIIFWGTPKFAAVILDFLIKNNYQPITVVTAPDKPVGRHAYRQAGKQILTPSPVKELAIKYDIPILQPKKLRENSEFKSQILDLNPDLFIVAAYGLILPKELLDVPKYGSLNVHPSLLPKYRGASPIQATILSGDQETGVTIISMDQEMDHGDIVATSKFKLQNSKLNYEELSKELANLGAKLLIEILSKWLNGEIKPVAQDHSKATFTKIIKKDDGRIDWSKSAEEIERQIRAFNPWPSAYSQLIINDKQRTTKRLKIIKADILDGPSIDRRQLEVGQVFLAENKNLAVTCGKNALILEEIQLEGKKPVTAKEFLNGYPETIGTILK